MTTKAQAMTAQANREVGPFVNQNDSAMAPPLRDFTRINPRMFYGSKVNEFNQDFIYWVYKIIYGMGFSLNEKAELASYQIKDVSQTWYT